jgi:hypothetical protein
MQATTNSPTPTMQFNMRTPSPQPHDAALDAGEFPYDQPNQLPDQPQQQQLVDHTLALSNPATEEQTMLMETELATAAQQQTPTAKQRGGYVAAQQRSPPLFSTLQELFHTPFIPSSLHPYIHVVHHWLTSNFFAVSDDDLMSAEAIVAASAPASVTCRPVKSYVERFIYLHSELVGRVTDYNPDDASTNQRVCLNYLLKNSVHIAFSHLEPRVTSSTPPTGSTHSS